jgi:membrane protease YdiL (CAAX protease family)
MKRYTFSSLIATAVLALFWSLVITDTLVRQLDTGVTYLDVGAVFVLGGIAGGALGVAFYRRRNLPKVVG